MPSAATELPSGDHSPVHRPPTDPVAVLAPLTSVISPSREVVSQMPDSGSGVQIARDESADAERSCRLVSADDVGRQEAV